MKLFYAALLAGALLSANILPAHGKLEEISGRENIRREVTLCNNIHGCRGSYDERSNRRDLDSLAWKRASGEGAAGEGAAGEGAAGGKGSGGGDGGADGEGAQGGGAQAGGAHGEGAQGQGAEGEGTQGKPPSNQSPGDSPPPEQPATPPSDYIAGSDGSLPDRNSDDVQSDNSDPYNVANKEILQMSEYKTKGQGYYDLMMQSINREPKREPTYDSFDVRYRLKSDMRSPVAEDKENMAFVLHLEDYAPDMGIDLKAEDWTYDRLISKGQPDNLDTDAEENVATLVTYGSKSQKTIVVYRADSIENDIPAPDNPNAPKLPNSELTFQLIQRQAGDEVSDTRLLVHHAITQEGTRAVLADAHQSKGIALDKMGTWTAADGDVFRNILGTRNGRPGVFLLTDHPTAMKCKIVTKIYTWARIPGDSTGNAAIALELGAGSVTC